MTLKQYKAIIDCYKDFYSEDVLSIDYMSNTLKAALEAKEEDVPPEDLNRIKSISAEGIGFIIHYPELTLTNDYGKQYKIYDVYVETEYPYMDVSLGRTTYTINEIQSGYIHSHVHTGYFKSLSTFCTGDSDTPVNQLKDYIRYRVFNNIEDFNYKITSFIIAVERMIKIESLAGVPYTKFDNVGKASTSVPISLTPITDTLYLNSRHRKALTKFVNYYLSLHLDTFYYDGKCYQLNATDEEFIDRVTNAAFTYKRVLSDPSWFEQIDSINGLYYKRLNINDNPDVHGGETVNWSFKGEYPKIRIIGTSIKVEHVTILKRCYIYFIYNLLLQIINGIYATDKYNCCPRTRAHKIKVGTFKYL